MIKTKVIRKLATSVAVFLLSSQVALAAGGQAYTVKPGDSLFLIAKKFNISISSLKTSNKLTSNEIYPGQSLYISTNQASVKTYTVVPGDSLFFISKRFNVPIYTLKKVNNLTSDIIYPGQVFKIPSITSNPSRSEGSGKILVLDWFNTVNKMFPNGTKVRVTDVDTGLVFWVARSFGHNHADIEPVTKQDTAIMKQAWGGAWSWTRRAVIVELNGKRLAASMNGMPHGQYLNHNNGMVGQVCMHFLNSRTHETNRVDPAHQAAIRKAAQY